MENLLEKELTWLPWEMRLDDEDPWQIAKEALEESGRRVDSGDLVGMWTCLIFLHDILLWRVAPEADAQTSDGQDATDIETEVATYHALLAAVQAEDPAALARSVRTDLWAVGRRLSALANDEG